MNFDYSPKVRELQSRVTRFMEEHVYQISQPESAADFQAFLRESIVRETAVMNRLGLKAG